MAGCWDIRFLSKVSLALATAATAAAEADASADASAAAAADLDPLVLPPSSSLLLPLPSLAADAGSAAEDASTLIVMFEKAER